MRKYLFLAVIAAVGFAGYALIPSTEVSAKQQKIFYKKHGIPNRYIVVLDEEQTGADLAPQTVESNAQYLANVYGGEVRDTYSSALKGFVSEMSAQEAEAMSHNPNVRFVEQDEQFSVSATELNAGWNLDRVDQRNMPMDSVYGYSNTGAGVHAYILDTGIRATHVDFGGRADVAFDNVGDGQNGYDCNGHGTHVAGTIGGATYGVAKGVYLHAVRVMGCNGAGQLSAIIAGVDWVTKNHRSPAVANMSIAGGSSPSLDSSVTSSISSGVTYAVSAGNGNVDACNISPARTSAAITVGASDQTDLRASYSNWGACVDLFAPGDKVISDGTSSDTATREMSGTSMAAPMVAGAAALYLESNPGASPQTVANAIGSTATKGVLNTLDTTSPNTLLYSWVSSAPAPTPSPTPTITPTPSPSPTASPTPTSTPKTLKIVVKKRTQTTTTSTTAFPYAAVNLSTSSFSLLDNQDYIDSNVTPSTTSNPIVVTESPVQGWQLNSISCIDTTGGVANTSVDLTNHTVSIVGAEGQQIECTFTSEPLSPTAAPVSVSGRVMTASGSGVRGIEVQIVDRTTGQVRSTLTNSFGFYTFSDLTNGDFYQVSVASKKYHFSQATKSFSLTSDLVNVNFTANK